MPCLRGRASAQLASAAVESVRWAACEYSLVRAAGPHRELDAPDADGDARADLQQLQADGTRRALRESLLNCCCTTSFVDWPPRNPCCPSLLLLAAEPSNANIFDALNNRLPNGSGRYKRRDVPLFRLALPEYGLCPQFLEPK